MAHKVVNTYTITVCYSVLQCVTVCYSVLQCVTVCNSVLQCVTVCYSVLQYSLCVSMQSEYRNIKYTSCKLFVNHIGLYLTRRHS